MRVLKATQCNKSPKHAQRGFYNKTMNYKFLNPETNQEENVELERWCWGVLYKDGTELHQFARNGKFNRIGSVDQSKVDLFVLYHPGDGKGKIDIKITEDMRLIHKYRNVVLNVGTPEQKKFKIYMFGYKKGNNYNINYIMPNDNIIQSTDPDLKLTEFGLR